ncbi:MAG TPA: hypothetical protein VMW40_05615 [Candidatus Bathyarchaeia archaeon]|nr:hypothetical protein [Candidatus Bathyarchaeia archaeon]
MRKKKRAYSNKVKDLRKMPDMDIVTKKLLSESRKKLTLEVPKAEHKVIRVF